MTADDFLAELAVLLAGDVHDADAGANRRTRVLPDDAATAKSVAAFVVEGPEVVDESTTLPWLLERFEQDSAVEGRDVLSSVVRGFLPKSAKPLLYAGAGPRRYVAVAAFGRPVESIGGYTFTTVESLLGPGWRLRPTYAAVSAPVLKDFLRGAEPDPTVPFGRRVLDGALHVARERARA